MLHVIVITNPYDVHLDDVQRVTMDDGLTIRDIVDRLLGEVGGEFEYPTICLVDSEPVLREGWGEVLKDHSVVTFVRMATSVAVIIAVAVVIVAVAVSVMVSAQNPAAIGAADAPGEQKNGDTVYSLNGQRNQNRLNSSIECAYGRNRLYPSYAAQPYNIYDGNQQFQFSLYCLGHGWFTIEQMRFEDTAIQNFDDVEFEIVNPGETFDLFTDNVVTSAAVSNIELFGPNEKDYTGPTGAFVVNAPFTKCNRIELDVSLPAGLYKLNEENKLRDAEVEVLFEYQRITDQGAVATIWQPLPLSRRRIVLTVPSNDPDQTTGNFSKKTIYTTTTSSTFHKEMKEVTPQRFTVFADVEPGRYQVRARRLNEKDESIQSGNVVKWESMRAFFKSVRLYGDVTLIAIKARATNNLNNNAAQRFNVIATRRLKTWNLATQTWGPLTVTRNPVWAFCDIFRATYGGRLPDTFLDLVALSTLATYFRENKITFDYIFDQRATVWEAARSVCQVGRAVPMLNGSRITMIRDTSKSTALAVFNQRNIVQGSFTWSMKLRNIQDNDGIEMQYQDPDTWEQETVLCLIGTDVGLNPEQVKLPGCSSRKIAYQEGLYRRAVQLYNRENIEFRTGLEGFLPRYGDLILVSHDVPRWGTGGQVEGIAGEVLTLDSAVTFTPGQDHVIVLRKKDGSAYGPVPVLPGVDTKHVIVTPPILETFYFDDVHERPYFLFGVQNLGAKRCTVVGLTPENADVVSIKCVNYDDRVFGFEAAVTPLKNAPGQVVTDPPRPVVTSLNVTPSPNTEQFVIVSWPPALGARTYVLEKSSDAVNWTRVATLPSTSYEIRINIGVLYLRVAGVNADIGPWAYWNGQVGDVTTVPGHVLNLHIVTLGAGLVTVGWDALTTADRYEIQCFDRVAGIMLRTLETELLVFTYSWDMGDIDGLTQSGVLIRVKGVNLKGKSVDSTIINIVLPERAVLPTPVTADQIDPTVDTLDITTDNP